jgi:hypothetical protein
MSLERLEKAEPAALVGLVTSLLGFLGLSAADFSTIHSAGLAVGMAGTQALFTRSAVFSPKSVEALDAGGLRQRLPDLLATGSGFAHPDEPAATIGVLTLLGGFLVQVFAGVEFAEAFVSAAGIAGVQTAATRARVYPSPAVRQRAIAGVVEGAG